MSLPIRTSLDDINAICNYLKKKPTGATIKEAKAVLGNSRLDHRKISAMKDWGLIDESEGRLKILPSGRDVSKKGGKSVFVGIIKQTEPYRAIVERAAHRSESLLTATDVAGHWHDHYRSVATGNDASLNDQAISFFHIAQGANLGTLMVGRKGSPTRFDFDSESLALFIEGAEPNEEQDAPQQLNSDHLEDLSAQDKEFKDNEVVDSPEMKQEVFVKKADGKQLGKAIFIAHGKNKKPLEQLKKILEQFKIQYKVAVDEPNLGRPIGEKVRATMQDCNCAILIFTADEEFKDKEGNAIWRPSENVVYELGACSYLYENRVVIMKEDVVAFPSNFRDVGYISFANDQLEAKAMEIVKELIGFEIVKIST